MFMTLKLHYYRFCFFVMIRLISTAVLKFSRNSHISFFYKRTNLQIILKIFELFIGIRNFRVFLVFYLTIYFVFKLFEWIELFEIWTRGSLLVSFSRFKNKVKGTTVVFLISSLRKNLNENSENYFQKIYNQTLLRTVYR